MAPHLVHPLRFVLPLDRGGRVGMFKMGMGMWLYDALSMFEAPEPHERLSPGQALERLPLLQARGLQGAYVYSDAYMDDDRLTLETLRSAVRMGAVCVNHVRATGARMQDGKVQALVCRDQLSGRELTIKGRHFVSTTGPWTDEVASSLLGAWRKILRPTKGVHLTFSRSRIPLEQAVVMAADSQKRIVFGIPRHEMILIGTTDTAYSGDPADVSATPEDVRYLLKIADEYFPGAKLTAADVISTYAGVRPLVDDGAETESKTSREHLIVSDPRNITFVAGGKYTTYRRMAEQTVETVLERFSIEDQVRYRFNDTKSALNPQSTPEKLEEALRAARVWAREFGWSEASARLLAERHGGEAYEILRLSDEARAGRVSAEHLWSAELRHAVRQTMCVRLLDFYLRRAPLFLANADHGLALLPELARVMQRECDWSDSQRQEQEAAVRGYVEKELSWKREFKLNP